MTGLEVILAGIKLEYPLMNAAGTVKTLEDVKKIAPSSTAAIMIGSITVNARSGNEGNIYWSSPDFSLNSLGLPNPGSEYYKRHLREMVSIAHDSGKPLFVSIAGFTRMEYVILSNMALEQGADLVEWNLGCPNVWDNNQQKGILSFYPDEIAELLRSAEYWLTGAPIAAKLSPISNPYQLLEVARTLKRSQVAKVVTAVNCFPNAIALDDIGRPRTDPGNGLAGLGGKAMLGIGQGQVKQLRQYLPDLTQIIGVGGVSSGRHILDYKRAGASIVQINTAYSDRGEQIFGEILTEYVNLID